MPEGTRSAAVPLTPIQRLKKAVADPNRTRVTVRADDLRGLLEWYDEGVEPHA